MDVGRQKEVCLSEILGLLAVSFSPGTHILVCICDHTHLSSSFTKELFLRGVGLFCEFHSTRFGDAAEMVCDRPCYRFTAICSMYEVVSVASVTFPGYFLLSGTRE